MAKLALFGPTGMLGNAVYGVLSKAHELVLLSRDENKLTLLDNVYGGVRKHRFVCFDVAELYQDYIEGFSKLHQSPKFKALTEAIGEVDGVVNAVGVIKPYSTKDPAMTLFINGAFPHILAAHYGQKLIQITTDCAYSGLEGAPYTEESPKSANDLYGLSKAIGEPAERSLVLRTSIIGPELHSKVSLLEWFKQQGGKTIKGFTNHYWNGITTKQFGKICATIFDKRSAYPQNGLYHIFANDISKFDMVQTFKAKYNVDVTIEPATPDRIDRRLATVKDLCTKLKIPSFQEMLADLP